MLNLTYWPCRNSRPKKTKSLVLFHGWGFDTTIWYPFASCLTSQFEVFGVDLPGFGKTPWMSWELFKAALLQQFSCPFILLGWSLGGTLATQLALESPDRISHLINMAASPRFLAAPEWVGVHPAAWRAFCKRYQQNPLEGLQFFQQQVAGSVYPALAESSAGLQAGLETLKTSDFRKQLDQLTPPTLWIFGEQDPIFPSEVLACMKKNYPYFDYALIPGAGHLPFQTDPHQCFSILSEFIQ